MFKEYKKAMNSVSISVLIPAGLLFIAFISAVNESYVSLLYIFMCTFLAVLGFSTLSIADEKYFNNLLKEKNLGPINVVLFFYILYTIMHTTGFIIMFIFSFIIDDANIFLAFLLMMTSFIYVIINIRIFQLKFDMNNSYKVTTQKENEIFIEKIYADAPKEELGELILAVGKKFFIDYYYQLKNWNETDVYDYIGDNISADDKHKRIATAKQIFNLKLNVLALEEISNLSENLIDKATINKAKTILKQEIDILLKDKKTSEINADKSPLTEPKSEEQNNQKDNDDIKEESTEMNDELAKKCFHGLNLKEGQIINVSERHELLNLIFDTNLSSYNPARWIYKEGLIVWMVKIDGQERNGWKNFESENKIYQINEKNKTKYDGKPIQSLMEKEIYRIVFEIITINDKDCFAVKGVYKCDLESSNLKIQVFNKI